MAKWIRKDTHVKAGYRAEALTLAKLAASERHGKRLDETSQKRRVRDAPPLVYGSLDLREAYDRHVAGARMNTALKKPVLHALIQFPTKLKLTPKNEAVMLRAAVDFVNRTHGGDAVFAARLDRDEAGRHTVDVFFSPKYEKQTKRKGAETWVSTTKHGKELALKHADEIKRRSPNARDVSLTSPRAVGIAMQTELAAFLAEKGLKLEPRREKSSTAPDRVDPETFKARQDAKKAREKATALEEAAQHQVKLATARSLELDAREAALSPREKALEARELELNQKGSALQEQEKKLDAMLKSVRGLIARVAGIVKIWSEELGLTVPGPIKTVQDLEAQLEEIEDNNRDRIAQLDPLDRDPDGPGF